MAPRIEELRLDEVAAVEATDLHRFFRTETDDVVALRAVSLRVRPGEFVAVVGPSGSGKSTLLSCLAGLDDPDGGRVFVCGERVSHRPERDKAALRAKRVGFVFQTRNLIDHLTVRENVVVALRAAGRRSGSADGTIHGVGLSLRSDATPPELSGGEASRAAVAVAIAKAPAVLLADEPTGELDEASEEVVLELLRAAAAGGSAVVVATHSERVARVAHRVVRLEDGRVVDE